MGSPVGKLKLKMHIEQLLQLFASMLICTSKDEKGGRYMAFD